MDVHFDDSYSYLNPEGIIPEKAIIKLDEKRNTYPQEDCEQDEDGDEKEEEEEESWTCAVCIVYVVVPFRYK